MTRVLKSLETGHPQKVARRIFEVLEGGKQSTYNYHKPLTFCLLALQGMLQLQGSVKMKLCTPN
jgi:hypothetical protein